MEKLAGLMKLLMTKFSREWMKTSKYWPLFGKGNIDGLAMFWDMVDFCMKLVNAKWEVNQQQAGEDQMLHDLANDGGYIALKWAAEDTDGDMEKGCQKPALQ